MSGLTGSMTTLPIAKHGWSSVSGAHDVPAFVVFHTPPVAVPTYSVCGSVGCSAILFMRPAYARLPPTLIGAGPSDIHDWLEANVVSDGDCGAVARDRCALMPENGRAVLLNRVCGHCACIRATAACSAP